MIPWWAWFRFFPDGRIAADKRILDLIGAEYLGPYPNGRAHGKVATYSHGCRCGECRKAWRIYRAERRKAGVDA
jgi:hypothetical protein